MIENITRQNVEDVMSQTIENFNNSTDTKEYKFNIWVDGELVDVLTVPSYLANIYKNTPIFVEVTENPIFQ
jgi:hypothetical protein